MQVVVLLLLVASLALLVSGLITGGTPLVVASIVTSLAAAYAISRHRGRQPATAGPRSPAADGSSRSGGARAGAGGARSNADDARATAVSSGVGVSRTGAAVAEPGAAGPADAPSAARRSGPALVADPRSDGTSSETTEPVRAADLIARAQAASRTTGGAGAAAPAGEHRADSEPGAEIAGRAGDEPPATPLAEATGPDGSDADEPPVAETDPPLRSRGDEPVWVIDGRPRYHLSTCGFLAGRDAEPVPLRQAVGDGFTPCALCDPDSALAAS